MKKAKETQQNPPPVAGSVFIAENGKKYFKLKGRVYSLEKEYKNDLVTAVQESIKDTKETFTIFTKRSYKRSYKRKDGKEIKKVVEVKAYKSNLGYEVSEKKYLDFQKKKRKKPKSNLVRQQLINQSLINQISIALAKGAKVVYNGEIVTLSNFGKIKRDFRRRMKAKVKALELDEEEEADTSPLLLFEMETDFETQYFINSKN